MKKSDSLIDRVFKSSLVSMTAAVIVTMLSIVIGRFLGPECMAVYSLAAPITSLVIMLLHFRKPNIIFKFSLAGLKLADLKDILVAGCPSAVGNVSTMARSFTLN